MEQSAQEHQPPLRQEVSPSGQTMVDGKTHVDGKHATHEAVLDTTLDPMQWPVLRKIYVSSSASLFTFALLFNATAITAGLGQVSTKFGISMTEAIITYSLFLFGIAFAPLFTPHLSEKMGRNPTYFIGTFISSMFLIGASRSTDIASLAACRFFAGFFQGPVVVLIEGTYADVWEGAYTGTYYIFITSSQYLGAATGALVGAVVTANESWRWTQYVGLMINLLAIIYAVGVPETYARQIKRAYSKRAGVDSELEPAASGDKIGRMAKLTVFQPLLMLVSDPLTIMIALYLSLNFGVLFQFFILVPATLKMVAKYTVEQSGFAFIAAYGGVALAIVTAVIVDQIAVRMLIRKGKMNIEHRMIPAIWGSLLMIASLFWVGWTASPDYKPYVSIIGTAFFVYGSASSLTAFVGYLFDAYEPPETLSALTACAVTRVLTAGWFPLIVLTAVSNITGKWVLSTFGFINIGFLIIPIIVFFFGAKLREKSRYGGPDMMNTTMVQEEKEHPGMMSA